MPILRTIACLLLIGTLCAPAQAQQISRADIDEMLSVIGEPGFIDTVVAQRDLPVNVRPHAADHLAALWSRQSFRDHVAREITRNQAHLTGATGELSEHLVAEFTAQLNETLFSIGAQTMPPADIREFLEMTVTIMRRMEIDDCIALAGGRLSATDSQAAEMQALGGFSDREIARYFELLRTGVLAAISTPSPGSGLTAAQMETAERIFAGALESAIEKHPESAQMSAALMSLHMANNEYHCEALIMIIEESARMRGEVGDLVVRWFAHGMIE